MFINCLICSTTDKHTDFLYNWEMTKWLGYKSYIWKFELLDIFVSETTTIAQASQFDNEREVFLYLGLVRSWNRLCAISDTWSWGEVTTCALYDREKMRTASPKSNGSHSRGQHTPSSSRFVHVLLQALLVSVAVNWSPWNNTTSTSVLWLPSDGRHSWCTGQSLCHQNSTFKTLHNNQSPNHSTSKHLKFAERTGHQLIYECNTMGNWNQNAWE